MVFTGFMVLVNVTLFSKLGLKTRIYLTNRIKISKFLSTSSSFGARPRLFDTLPSLTQLKASAGAIDSGLFEGIPAEFDPGYKNPCWIDTRAAMHCLPYFYVLSGFQSGIQDLQAKMLKHPDIVASGNPQPHFWAEQRANNKLLRVMDVAVPRIKEAPSRRVVGYALYVG